MATEQHQATIESTVPSLPELASSSMTGESLGSIVDDASNQVLAEMAERVKVKATAVQIQASELQELEARLQAAELKRAELEAKGVQV
ncbi:hypothetical protein CBS101457_006727 [Exobasidium rhododendri]|nr:hypothetical protein CBS101457_006727 [Exobasidium rhododendri]